LTPEERREIMGNRGDVYERYYMPNSIDRDTLAIYLGTTLRDDLIQAVGHLECHEEAPDKLTDAQKREIWNDPEILRLLRRRGRYAAKIKQCGYPTIKAAKGTKYFTRHAEAQSRINSLKTKLSRKLLDKTIDEFHETVREASCCHPRCPTRPLSSSSSKSGPQLHDCSSNPWMIWAWS
jgi:ABC-type phosphate transport system auxiliary subunit